MVAKSIRERNVLRLGTLSGYSRFRSFTLIYPQKSWGRAGQSLSQSPETAYIIGMGARRADSIAYQEIRNPVSEDFVTLIVVAMLTSMTIVLSVLG